MDIPLYKLNIFEIFLEKITGIQIPKQPVRPKKL